MNKNNIIKKINILIIALISIISIIFLFFGNHEKGIYKTLIILSIIPVMLLPYIINLFLKKKIEEEIIFVYLIFIILAHFLGTIMNFYYKISIYDKLMHGLSGIMTSILAIILLIKTNCLKKNPIWVNVLFIISITFSVASLWEFFEFINDNIFSKDAQKVLTTGVDDTMMDMIMAFIGSIIFSIDYFIESKFKKNFIITKFINKLN